MTAWSSHLLLINHIIITLNLDWCMIYYYFDKLLFGNCSQPWVIILVWSSMSTLYLISLTFDWSSVQMQYTQIYGHHLFQALPDCFPPQWELQNISEAKTGWMRGCDRSPVAKQTPTAYMVKENAIFGMYHCMG